MRPKLLEVSHIPPETVTYNRMSVAIRAIKRDLGLSMIWMTRVVPDDDTTAMDCAMELFCGA